MRHALLVTGCALLAGCAAEPAGEPADLAAVFPLRVGRFERVELLPATEGRSGVMAGYQSAAAPQDSDDTGPVVATVHIHAPRDSQSLLPSLDRTPDPAAVAAADLARSQAQVRRFYPRARPGREAAAFLIQQGVLRPGRRAVVEFDEQRGEAVQPVRLEIYTFCCDAAGMVHEYRFRYAPDAGPDLVIAAFMRALPW